jgi:predicted transcriptional regulator
MKHSAIVTTRVPADTAAILDKVAAIRGQSRSAYVARVIEEAARREANFMAFVQEGIDQLDRGEGIPHETVMAELDDMIARHEARCRD